MVAMTDSPDLAGADSAAHARAAIAVACIATAMLMLDISVVNTALEKIASGLDTGLSGLQWVIDAYTVPLAAVVLTAGSIADRFGRRRLFALGMVGFVAASAVCASAVGIEMLVTARAVQGLAAAVLFATGLALISDATPTPEKRAGALAAFGATIGAAFAIGPFVGGSLTEWLGWRAIFWINVPIGAVALLISLTRVPESRDPQSRRVDVPGQLALIGGLFLLVFALLRGNQDGWGSAGILAALAGAAALLIGFVVIEHRSTEPMLPLALFRQRHFTGPQVAVFGISASFFAVFLYMTLYLQGVVGLSPIETGLAYLPSTILIFIVSGMTAQLMNRIAPVRLAVAGLGLIAAGLLLELRTDVGSSWTATLPGLLVAGLGAGLFNPTASALALEALPPEQSGLASGVNDTFRQTGVAVGIAWLGTFMPAAGVFGGDPGAYVDGLHHAFIAGAALAALCALLTGYLMIWRAPALDEDAVAEAA
jgi:EmrB/QacA subfamily drug resistance transporter